MGCPLGAALGHIEKGKTHDRLAGIEDSDKPTALEGAYAVLSKWGIDSFAVEDSDLMDRPAVGLGVISDVEPSEQATIICYLAEDRLAMISRRS